MKKYVDGVLEVEPEDIRFIIEHEEIFNYIPDKLWDYRVSARDEITSSIPITDKECVSFLESKDFILNEKAAREMYDDQLIDYYNEVKECDDRVTNKVDMLTTYRPLEKVVVDFPEYYTYSHIICQLEKLIKERNLGARVKTYTL